MAASRLENLKDLKREWKDYSDDAEFSENRYFHCGSDCLTSSKMREERALSKNRGNVAMAEETNCSGIFEN